VFSNKAAYSAIAAYDLDTKERKFLSQLNGIDAAGDSNGVFCNDIVQTSDGANAYLTESSGGRIFNVTSTGVVTLESDNAILFDEVEPTPGIIAISGIEINTENELIIAQPANRRLLKYSLATKVYTVITGLSRSELNIHFDGIIFTNEARTSMIVTNPYIDTVYICEFNGSSITVRLFKLYKKVVDSQKILAVSEADKGRQLFVTTTVKIGCELYALGSFLGVAYMGIVAVVI
jgi:hypothetical protein